MSAKEKLYQLLSYQVGVVAAFFQEHGILLYLCNITGVPAIEMDSLEINLEAKKEEVDKECLKYNYSLEVEIVDHILAFMDIKNMLKKIRKENL